MWTWSKDAVISVTYFHTYMWLHKHDESIKCLWNKFCICRVFLFFFFFSVFNSFSGYNAGFILLWKISSNCFEIVECNLTCLSCFHRFWIGFLWETELLDALCFQCGFISFLFLFHSLLIMAWNHKNFEGFKKKKLCERNYIHLLSAHHMNHGTRKIDNDIGM